NPAQVGGFHRAPSAPARDAGITVESGIERHDLFDAVFLTDRDVHRLTGEQWAAPEYYPLGAVDHRRVDRKDLINDSEQSIEGGLYRIAPIDRNISMQDLLHDLGVGYQSAPLADALLQQTLRVRFMRMRSSHEVHGNVRVDQDHRRGSPT